MYEPPWRFDVTVRRGVTPPIPLSRLTRVAASTLSAAGAPSPAALGLLLTDDRELATLNEQHMAEPGPTDVLSFPLLPPAAFPPHAGQDPAVRADAPDFASPPEARVELGDVVISVERAAAQAGAGRGGQTGDVRWSAGDELRLLAVHGVLHICGWDHAQPAEESAMRAMERELLGSSEHSAR